MRLIYSMLALLLTTTFAWGDGRNITYQVDGKDYEGYYTSPSDHAPLILLMHDWDGLTDYEVKRAEMLNKLGYAVFALDLFGKGIRPTLNIDKRQHTGELYKDRKKMRKLMRAALAKAADLGADTKNAIAMGYCFGGAAVLELARSGEALKAFVTFHGGLKTPKGQDHSKTKGFVMVFHGSGDSNITLDDYVGLTKELEANKVPHEMITYSGAPHAFTVFGSSRYTERADKESWARFTRFLNEVIPVPAS